MFAKILRNFAGESHLLVDSIARNGQMKSNFFSGKTLPIRKNNVTLQSK